MSLYTNIFIGCVDVKLPHLEYDFFHFESSCLRIDLNSDWTWASLVAQWLRTRLPMQGIRVRALVREDPTCRRAAKSMRHNY